jgi:hypothetical protein
MDTRMFASKLVRFQQKVKQIFPLRDQNALQTDMCSGKSILHSNPYFYARANPFI